MGINKTSVRALSNSREYKNVVRATENVVRSKAHYHCLLNLLAQYKQSASSDERERLFEQALVECDQNARDRGFKDQRHMMQALFTNMFSR